MNRYSYDRRAGIPFDEDSYEAKEMAELAEMDWTNDRIDLLHTVRYQLQYLKDAMELMGSVRQTLDKLMANPGFEDYQADSKLFPELKKAVEKAMAHGSELHQLVELLEKVKR